MSSLYNDLGVSQTANADEIKKAYREAAFKYHPDRNQGNAAAEEKFKKISAAYSVLGDEAKRNHYDLYGDSANNTANAWAQQANSEAEYDPFEELFRQNRNTQQGRRHTYTYYGPFSNSSQKTKPHTKKDFLFLLIRSLFSVGIATFFFRFSLFLGIFGIIITGSILVNGISGSIRALQGLFNARGK